MLSDGMLASLAFITTVRKRGFVSTLPPPFLAATVNSLINFVNKAPRLASSAPFLCLIVAHLECPDMAKLYHSPPQILKPFQMLDHKRRFSRIAQEISGMKQNHHLNAGIIRVIKKIPHGVDHRPLRPVRDHMF